MNPISYKKLGELLEEYKEKNVENKYKPVAVGKYGIRKREDIYKKELAKDYSKNKLIYKNTLTIGMGSKQIDIGILSDDVIYSVSSAYHTFKISGVDANYLRYCLESRNADMSERYMIASARQGKSVDIKRLLQYEIPIYSESDTKEILYNLQKIEQIIKNIDEQKYKMEMLIKARFVEVFGDPITNSKGWNIVSFDDCLDSIENGKSFVCDSNARREEKPAILKLSAVTNGVYKPDENKAILDEEDFVESAEVCDGDLLFTRKNTPELVGMAAYVEHTPRNLMMPDLVFRLNTKKECNKVYLWKLINHDLYRSVIMSAASGSAESMSNISQERLGKLKLPLPPIEIQVEFEAFVKQVDKSKVAVEEISKRIEVLKASVMQKYFC